VLLLDDCLQHAGFRFIVWRESDSRILRRLPKEINSEMQSSVSGEVLTDNVF
jgi:hypothetical protein